MNIQHIIKLYLRPSCPVCMGQVVRLLSYINFMKVPNSNVGHVPETTFFKFLENVPIYKLIDMVARLSPQGNIVPRQSRGQQCFSRGDDLPCHPIKNVIFILSYQMSPFPLHD